MGSFILYKLTAIIDIDENSIYRDNGLMLFENTIGRKINKSEKNLLPLFKILSLKQYC